MHEPLGTDAQSRPRQGCMAMLRKKLIGVVGAAASAALLLAGPASAAPADLVITAGPLGFDGGAATISAFNPITLTGVPQLTSLTVTPFTVKDASGSAAGWNVLLTIPDLDDGATHTIAASNISMSAPTVAAVGTSDMTGVAGHASAGCFAAGEKIVDASAGNGMGMYLVSPF